MPQAEIKTRRLARLSHRLPANFITAGQMVEATIVNLSEGGFFIMGRNLADLDTLQNFYVKLGSREIGLLGRIVHHHKDPMRAGVTRRLGMGVELVKAPKSYLDYVGQLRRQVTLIRASGQPRYPVDKKVFLQLGRLYVAERISDISLGGMFVATKQPMEIGEVILVRLTLPGRERAFEIQGKVVHRIDSGKSALLGRPAGIGIHFLDLTPDVERYLYHFVRRLKIHRQTASKRCKKEIPLVGNLGDYLVPEVLNYLYNEACSGVLELQHRYIKKKIYLLEGHPVFVDSNLRTETLGRYLVRQGRLTPQQLQETIGKLEKSPLYYGEILLREGILSSQELAEALVGHQEEKLSNTFSWFYGDYCFKSGLQWPTAISLLPLRPLQIFMTGVCRWYPKETVSTWVGFDGTSVLCLKQLPEELHSLPTLAQRLLEILDSPISLEQAATALDVSLSKLVPIAFSLLLLDWIELYDFSQDRLTQVKQRGSTEKSPKSTDASLHNQIERDYKRFCNLNYYEVFSLSGDLDETVLRNQYIELLARYSKGRVATIEDKKKRNKAIEIRGWIRTAFMTLCNPQLRRVYDQLGTLQRKVEKHQKHVRLEKTLTAVLRELQHGDVVAGIETLEELIEEWPNDPTLAGYLGWALFRQDPRKHMRQACKMLDQAVEHDPADPQSRYFLGKVEAHLGNWPKAATYLKQAIGLHPHFEEAKKAFQEVAKRGTSSD